MNEKEAPEGKGKDGNGALTLSRTMESRTADRGGGPGRIKAVRILPYVLSLLPSFRAEIYTAGRASWRLSAQLAARAHEQARDRCG